MRLAQPLGYDGREEFVYVQGKPQTTRAQGHHSAGSSESDLDIDIWIPQSSFFLLFDISRVPIREKFMKDKEGKDVTKDIGFAYQLAEETGLVMMPGCCYFGDKTEGRDRYIRIAFCKER